MNIKFQSMNDMGVDNMFTARATPKTEKFVQCLNLKKCSYIANLDRWFANVH
jgi:hypothetical protein